jgi:hypothetical protein
MKAFTTAALAAALALSGAAAAQSSGSMILTNTPEMAAGYDNMGQCMAAFRQLRNDQRKSGNRGGEPYNSMDNGDYNEASRTTTRCEEIRGRYYVVFNANGF